MELFTTTRPSEKNGAGNKQIYLLYSRLALVAETPVRVGRATLREHNKAPASCRPAGAD